MKAIKTRWTESGHSISLQNIISLFKNGGILTEQISPFMDVEDGIKDFRGIDLESLKICDLKVNDADFSFSNFSRTWIEQSSLSNVRFLKTDFSNSTDHANVFNNCSFVNCNFNGRGFGDKGSQYLNCKFENCTFIRSRFIRAEFTNCIFEKCKINNIDFNASSFEDCEFIGVMNSVWFRGGFPLPSETLYWGKPRKNEMKNVSFEFAVLNGATFSNDCDLATIVIPSTGDYKLFNNWKNKLGQARVISETFSGEMKKEVKIFVNSYIAHAQTQDCYLINFEDIRKMWKSPFSDKIIEILKSLK